MSESLGYPSEQQAASAAWIVGPDDRVLVTGANGFIGTRVVNSLLHFGWRRIRCLVRPSGDLDALRRAVDEHPGGHQAVEIIEGNLLNAADCRRAATDVRVALHLAAGIDKSFAGCFMNSVLATRNLLDALLDAGALRRFVNVSSFAVYSNRGRRRGGLLDESCGLEDDFQERFDPYGYGKFKQERLVETYGRERGLPYVTLRPGAVFGPGRRALSGRIGIDTFGVFLHLGGRNRIPLTYVDNCADAVVLAGLVAGVEGEVFNVVDDDLPTSRAFLRSYKRHAGRFWSIPVAYPVASVLSSAWSACSRLTDGQLPPAFNSRRCAAEWKGNTFSNDKLKRVLGWRPRVSMSEGCARFFDFLGAQS